MELLSVTITRNTTIHSRHIHKRNVTHTRGPNVYATLSAMCVFSIVTSVIYEKVCDMCICRYFPIGLGNFKRSVGGSSAWRRQQHPLTAPEISTPWTRASSTSCRAWEWPGDEGRRQDTSGNRRATPVISSRTWRRTADTKTQQWNTQREHLLPPPETRIITS